MENKQEKAQSETRSAAERSRQSSAHADHSESIGEFRRLSGQGDSRGERVDREEIHERKLASARNG